MSKVETYSAQIHTQVVCLIIVLVYLWFNQGIQKVAIGFPLLQNSAQLSQ